MKTEQKRKISQKTKMGKREREGLQLGGVGGRIIREEDGGRELSELPGGDGSYVREEKKRGRKKRGEADKGGGRINM